jgi:hypothetical protein
VHFGSQILLQPCKSLKCKNWSAQLSSSTDYRTSRNSPAPFPSLPHLHRFQQAFVPAVRELDDEPLSNRNHSSKGSVLLRKLRIGMGQKDQAKKMIVEYKTTKFTDALVMLI